MCENLSPEGNKRKEVKEIGRGDARADTTHLIRMTLPLPQHPVKQLRDWVRNGRE
jgi:hypothetical protein